MTMTSPVPSRTFFRRCLSGLLGIAVPLFFSGCSWIEGHQSTFDTHGPVAKSQLGVFYTTLWVTGIIFVIVASVLAYATWRFRVRNADEEHAAPPPQSHGNPLIEMSLIAASVFALVIIAVPTLHAIRYTYDVPDAQKDNAYEVNATGVQWWFRFEYPSEKTEGAGALVTANELVIPAGRPVRVNLRTSDVIHSFWVPKLAGKVDMIPNRGNSLWLQADQPGYFWGQCAEFCGEDHAVMRFRVIALDEKDFAAWLSNQKQPARKVDAQPVELAQVQATPVAFRRNSPGWSDEFDANPFEGWKAKQAVSSNESPALVARGRKLFQEKTCVSCHSIRGHEGAGVTAPDLTHVGSRTTIAAGLLENNTTNLMRWILDPNNVKPNNKMYVGVPMGGAVMAGYMNRDAETGHLSPNIRVSPAEAAALAAYLQSLK
ncbi:MAG: cytochrome c oxidase subunit II [Nibricoccus sp.]